MGERGRHGWARILAIVGALLFLGGLGAAVGSHPVPAVGTGSGAAKQWAYGSDSWYNTTSITSTYSFRVSEFYGSQVITTATNTSSSSVELRALSATAFTESYVVCAPNCTTPTSSYYNLSLDEWSSELSYLNLTSSASVAENNNSSLVAPAYGISNATWIGGSNYSERYVYDLKGSLEYEGVDFSQTNSTYRVTFAPALGLVPWTLAKNLTWNATSNVTAAYLAKTGYLVTYDGIDNYTIDEYGTAYTRWSVPETEAVTGLDLGNGTLVSGANVTDIELGFSGAFDVAEGFFATPVSADLFGGATGNWSVGVVVGTIARTTSMEILHGSSSRPYQIVGATTEWSSTLRVVGLGSGYKVVLPPVSPTSSGNSQAQPEGVAYAQSQARCLVNACGGGTGGSPLSAPTIVAVPTWLVPALVGSSAAALVALAVRWRRRARPPARPAASEHGTEPPARHP
jgi:hypothetical protein